MAPPPPARCWDSRRVVESTLAGAGVAAAFLFLYRFRLVFLGAFVGVVLAAAVRPIVVVLARRGLRRDLGALLAFAVVSSFCLGVVLLALPFFVDQVATVAGRIPSYYADLRGWLAGSESRLLRHTAAQLPAAIDWGATTPLGADQIIGYLDELVGGLL